MTKPNEVNETERVIPELEDFADQIGQLIEYWGYKKIHGQVWTHIYLSKDPLDASQLMTRLQISKALVSITLKELTDYGVIYTAGKSPRGTKTYQAVEDITKPIFDTIRRRERRMVARLLTSHSLLARFSPEEMGDAGITHNRLEKLGKLIKLVDILIERIIRGKWLRLSRLFHSNNHHS